MAAFQTAAQARADGLRPGMNARLFPVNWRPLADEIAFAAGLGFECLQLVAWDEGIDPERLGEPFPAAAARLRRAGLELTLEIVARVSPDGRTRRGRTPLEAARASLPAAAELGVRLAHLHIAPSEPFDPPTVRALEQRFASDLAAALELAWSLGLQLGLEHNEPRLGLYVGPAPCRAALDAVPGLGFVWDLNHTPPAEVDGFLDLTPRMTVVHVSDTPLPALNAHYPVGEGSIDIPALLDALADRGFHGPAILEIGGHPMHGGFGRDTDEALRISLRRLRGPS
jgi:sugar phosphate isomerase/epimerase